MATAAGLARDEPWNASTHGLDSSGASEPTRSPWPRQTIGEGTGSAPFCGQRGLPLTVGPCGGGKDLETEPLPHVPDGEIGTEIKNGCATVDSFGRMAVGDGGLAKVKSGPGRPRHAMVSGPRRDTQAPREDRHDDGFVSFVFEVHKMAS